MSNTNARHRFDEGGLAMVPQRLKLFLWRKSVELSGLVLIAVTLAAALALASWSIADPSLNHAVARAPENLLGYPGAIIADLAIQVFGIGAVVALIAPLAWGSLLITRGMIERFRWRPLWWIVGTVVASGFLSAFPAPSSWPLPTALGGLAGDMVLPVLARPFRFLLASGALAYGLSALVFLATAIWITGRACALSASDMRRTGEFLNGEGSEMAIRGIGASARGLYRATAFLARLARGDGMTRRGATAAFGDMWRALRHGDDDIADIALDDGPGDDGQGRVEPHFGAGRGGGSGNGGPADPHRLQMAPQPAADAHSSSAAGESGAARQPAASPRSAPAVAYAFPPANLLAVARAKPGSRGMSAADLEQNARLLESVLDDFGIRGEIINAHPGPVVTLYELEPAPGIKSSRVIGLADDIARSMSAVSARVAVVPGRNAIGIELPNETREMVYLRELFESGDFKDSAIDLPLALGKDIGGAPVVCDLARMPHLLIAGTTGSGKSVGINTMILSLLHRLPPDQCKFIMIDPKMLELSVYDGIPHLLAPVVTDPKKAVVALRWVVREMEDRYQRMSKLGVRNIDGFNQRVREAAANGEVITRRVQTGFDPETGKPIHEEQEMALEKLPFIVVIVDEMADLMMVAGKEIEGAIQRLAQMARAAGIHMITATQRPSVDVITGTIKANFPTRISFQVTSKIDSRTILGEQGAEQLLGQGDMLHMAGGGRISRVHGPFVSDGEVEKVVRHLKKQGAPDYVDDVTAEPEDGGGWDGGDDGGGGSEEDDLYRQAVEVVLRDRKASTSYVQRRLSIGYNRAATIIERMEEDGLIGPANHAGKREILAGE